MQPTLLLVDDDQRFIGVAANLARLEGFKVFCADSLAAARSNIAQGRMDLILLDLSLPDGSGMELLGELNLAEQGQVVICTGNPTLASATRAVSSPVVEYLVKPIDGAQLQRLLRRACASVVPTERATTSVFPELLGECVAMQRLGKALRLVGPTDASILISGESGTGKEVVASTIHNISARKGAFIAINCGAVPSELLASQLFGHERGSFTGAQARHLGVFEQAAHGTLFLDEITEMPMHMQVYLLRVLETGMVTRVGGSEPIHTPVRIVAATNRCPHAAIVEGRLREDLYYRLADIPLSLPPLRERGADVILLARTFIERLNERYKLRKYLSPDSDQCLLNHSWPGNVRELRSAVQRAYLLQPVDALQIQPTESNNSTSRVPSATSMVFSVGTSLAEVEREVLLKTLAHFNYDKSATARVLGVSVRTVQNQLARLNSSTDGEGIAA